MSQSQLVDGRTGEPIGYNIYGGERGYTQGQERTYATTTNSAYVPAQTYGSGSGYREERVQGGYREERVQGGAYREERVGAGYVSGSNAQIVGTTVNTGKEVIKGESRIEYVPFEKKILEYKDQAKVERVPKKVKRVEYREERKVETIPREVTVTDYYAVEYLRQYIPQYVPEKRIEYIQVPKKQVRYEYIPVERYFTSYSDKLSTTPTRLLKKEQKAALRELLVDMLKNTEPPLEVNTEPLEVNTEPTVVNIELNMPPMAMLKDPWPTLLVKESRLYTPLDLRSLMKYLLQATLSKDTTPLLEDIPLVK